jgi:hypothetical protein
MAYRKTRPNTSGQARSQMKEFLIIALMCCGVVLFALYRNKDVSVSMSFVRQLVEFTIDARDAAPEGGGARPALPLAGEHKQHDKSVLNQDRGPVR